ncbi:MAG: BatA domain-containing protein [Fuerstiella sp.]
MSFLQPAILFALPLIALPILIHLINQNRHRTVHWAATMFLVQARRMARGMARLRYLLLMLARMLAIAGLIFAVSRPMAGGWLGLTASDAPDMTIVLLDRSASMEEQDPRTSQSKRSTALKKLIDLVQRTESGTKLVLFDSALKQPLEVSSVAELRELPESGPTATTADMPSLVQQVAEFIAANETGRTDIWICSDLRRHDWNPTAGRWESVRRELAMREGVRLFLLTYPEVTEDNVAVTVSGVHRRETSAGAELVMDIRLSRTGDTSQPRTVELTMVIDGARSRLDLEMTGDRLVRSGHAIPLDRDARQGWGRVELPRDANMIDNVYNFVYAEPAVRKSVIVSDDPQAAEIFRIAAGTPVDASLVYETEVLSSAGASAIPWESTAFLIWHAAIPDGLLARQLNDFVESGRSVLFFPPDTPNDNRIFNVNWTNWITPADGVHFQYRPWRTDTDLLANAESGAPLPVGQVQCFRACGLTAENAVPLWQLQDGSPLLLRAAADQGAAWFCSTLPTASASSLLNNGVTFYIMTQRALARGAAALGAARQLDCGTLPRSVAGSWTPLDAPSEDVWISQRTISAGLYQSNDTLLALNRPPVEDDSTVLTSEDLADVLAGLEYTRIDDEVGGTMQLASEIWRTFLVLMILALIVEALLCVPEAVSDSTRKEKVPA